MHPKQNFTLRPALSMFREMSKTFQRVFSDHLLTWVGKACACLWSFAKLVVFEVLKLFVCWLVA